jgi:phage-related tail protein
MDERERVNRAIADYLEGVRRRLNEGKSEIERQRAAVDETNAHMAGMSRWIEQTNQQLGEERARRNAVDHTDADDKR